MVRVLCGLIAGMVLALDAGAAEEQAHGLVFERWLRETFFGGYNPKGYTQKWDIPAEANKDHGEIPVNPKVAKYGMPVGMGDALRQFEIKNRFCSSSVSGIRKPRKRSVSSTRRPCGWNRKRGANCGATSPARISTGW